MTTKPKHGQHVEEDCIDMSTSPSTSVFSNKKPLSPTQSMEFEFQKNGDLRENLPLTSPADDLFFNGKLLPLHLPCSTVGTFPNLLHNSTVTSKPKPEESFSDSCNISPSTSCCVSQELNPESYFLNQPQPHKPWSKKLKLLRIASFPLRLQASRAYLRSLFTKSTCSNDSSILHKKPTRRSFRGAKMAGERIGHRRSFSDAVIKFSSSSPSCSSSASSSSFASSEEEDLIQGAIAYCKISQQSSSGTKKPVGDVGSCSRSASGIADVCEKQAMA